MYNLNYASMYLGPNEQLETSIAVERCFVNVLRNAGFVRNAVHDDSYDGFGAFSAYASEMLLQRTAMRNHPAFRGRESELIMTDAERWEKR